MINNTLVDYIVSGVESRDSGPDSGAANSVLRA